MCLSLQLLPWRLSEQEQKFWIQPNPKWASVLNQWGAVHFTFRPDVECHLTYINIPHITINTVCTQKNGDFKTRISQSSKSLLKKVWPINCTLLLFHFRHKWDNSKTNYSLKRKINWWFEFVSQNMQQQNNWTTMHHNIYILNCRTFSNLPFHPSANGPPGFVKSVRFITDPKSDWPLQMTVICSVCIADSDGLGQISQNMRTQARWNMIG